MLYVSYYKMQPKEILDPNVWFKTHQKDMDLIFQDDLVKQMVADVDESEVYSAYNIKSPILGGINCNGLSTGVKNLICCYWWNQPIDGALMGDNCYPWLLKIAKMKDVYITVYGIMNFQEDFECIVLNEDSCRKYLHTKGEFKALEAYYGLGFDKEV